MRDGELLGDDSRGGPILHHVLSCVMAGQRPFLRMDLWICWSSNSACREFQGKIPACINPVSLEQVTQAPAQPRCYPGSPAAVRGCGCVFSSSFISARAAGSSSFGITSGEKQIRDCCSVIDTLRDGSRGSSKFDAFPSFFSTLDPQRGRADEEFLCL